MTVISSTESFEFGKVTSLAADGQTCRGQWRAITVAMVIALSLAIPRFGLAQLTHPASITGTGDVMLRFNKTGAPASTFDIRFSSGQMFFDGPINGLIFAIDSGAPSNSLRIDGLGNVGVGTSVPADIGAFTSPGKFLNVRADGLGVDGIARLVAQGNSAAQLNLSHIGGPANQKVFRMQNANGITTFNIVKDDLASNLITGAITIKNLNGNIGLRQLNPIHPLHLASGAHCTAGGVFTSVSSRAAKEDIRPLTLEQARATVAALQPVGFRYKAEPTESYLGFIAEDVPELVASSDRKSLNPMDVVAVLTKVVQDQNARMDEQRRVIGRLEEVIKQQSLDLNSERDDLKSQRKLLTSLTKRLTDLESVAPRKP